MDDLRRARDSYLVEEIRINLMSVVPSCVGILEYLLDMNRNAYTIAFLFGLIGSLFTLFIVFKKPPIDWVSLYNSDLNEAQIAQSISIYEKYRDIRINNFWFVRTTTQAAIIFSLIALFFS